MEDAQIIALYFARNEEAIRYSDKKYGKYCRSIADRILKNDADSEECVSDTWLRAWNVIPPQHPQFLSAFFARITRNLALNRYAWENAAKRGGDVLCMPLEELSECVGLCGGDTASDERLSEILDRFISGLSKESRKIFLRRYWYMDTVKEIAKAYGIGESKVKMSLSRSRKRLKEMLEKEGISL